MKYGFNPLAKKNVAYNKTFFGLIGTRRNRSRYNKGFSYRIFKVVKLRLAMIWFGLHYSLVPIKELRP